MNGFLNQFAKLLLSFDIVKHLNLMLKLKKEERCFRIACLVSDVLLSLVLKFAFVFELDT